MKNVLIEKAKTAILANHAGFLGVQESPLGDLVIFSEGGEALTVCLPLSSFRFDGLVAFSLVQNELRLNRVKMQREFIEELVEA